MSTAIWRFELLGRLRAQRGELTPAHISVRRIGALIACLVVKGPAPVPRDELISLLWPDDPVEAAQNRLRVLLNNLKQHLESSDAPGSVLAANRSTVGLAPGSFSSDYHEFHTLIARAATQPDAAAVTSLEAAAALYRGELMDGLTDEWIVIERRRVVELRYQALRDLVSRLRAQGALDKAADYARQAVVAEPLDEEAHADLIELYDAQGRPSAGLRQYDQLKRLLNTELGARPSERTREIAARLTSQLGHGIGEIKRAVRPVALRSEPRYQTLAVVNADRTPLPTRLSRFFGRQDEIHALTTMLDVDSPTRLVTIVGPGGTGKTRAALQVAHLMAGAYCGRVYFAELSEIQDSASAPAALERAIGLTPCSDGEPLSRIIDVISQEPTLLVLDNLEQIVPDIGAAISTMLSEAPLLRCLATSRRSLGVDGEREFPLGPLQAPKLGATIEELHSHPGVALFLDRAAAVRSGFADTSHAVHDAADICIALEGLPLAIELAAARARTMTSSEIKRQTSGLLNLLVDVRGSLPVRHRSLRATIEWSYRLLTALEQQVFVRFTVFTGGFTAEAAAAVAFEVQTDVDHAGLILDRLCAASMISLKHRDISGAVSDRFVMLDTIREFGTELLSELPDHDAVRSRHFWYFARQFWESEQGSAQEDPPTQVDDFNIDDEAANLRLALEFGLSAISEPEVIGAAIALLCRLCRYWESRGNWSEGAGYLNRALALPDAAFTSDTHLRLTLSAARHACMLGQYDCAERYGNDGLEAAESVGNLEAMAEAHTVLGMAAFFRGDYPEAEKHHTHALNLWLALNDRKGVAGSSASLANVTFYLGRDQEAIQRFQEALAVYREMGDRFGSATVLQRLGNAWRQQGNNTAGYRDLSEALETFREAGYRQGIASCLHDLGLLLFFQAQYAAAYERYMESLDLFREIGYRRGEAVCLFNLAMYHLRVGAHSESRSYLRTAVELSARIGDRRNLAACLGGLGLLAHLDGNYVEARAEYTRGLSTESEIGSQGGIANSLTGLGCVALATGDLADAKSKLTESLAIIAQMGVLGSVADLLELHGQIQHKMGNSAICAQQYASAAAIRSKTGIQAGIQMGENVDEVMDSVRIALGETRFLAEWRLGEQLTTGEAVDLVLNAK